jgi:hypothetical protein
LSQRSQVIDSSNEASSEDAGIESEYDDSDEDNNAGSIGNDSVAPPRQPRKNEKKKIGKTKDARELFMWTDD